MEVMEEAQRREHDIGDFSEDEDTSSEEEEEELGGEKIE